MAQTSSQLPRAGLEDQRQEILEILHQLSQDLTKVYFLPGSQDYAKKMEELTHVRNRDLEGVISVLSDLGMPPIIALAGGSSCGKSTLFNTLAGEIASAVSLLRPTTSIPVLYHHPSKTAYFHRKDFMERYEKVVSQELMPPTPESRMPGAPRGRSRPLPRKLILYPSRQPDYPEDFALLDTPDVDTTEAQNKETAHDLFQVASLILFVFSTEKYADNRLWEDVQYLQNLGKPLAFVLNKLTPEHKTEGLLDDFKEHLREKGFDAARTEIFYVDKEQPETENYPQRLSQKVRDRFYEFFHTLLNPGEKKVLKFQLVSRSLHHVTERLEHLTGLLQAQERELLDLENRVKKEFLLSAEAMIHEIKLVGGLNNRAVLNLIRENLASLIGSLNVTLLKGARAVWQWLASIFGKEEKTLETSRDAIEQFIEGDFDKKFSILVSHLGDVEDHVQRLLKESCIGSSPELESGSGRSEEGGVGGWENRRAGTSSFSNIPEEAIQRLYTQEVILFKRWLEGEVRSRTQNLREVGAVWINLIDSVILILILLLFAYIGAKGGTITGEEAAAAAGVSWVWDWLVTKFWGKEELERFMVLGGERYLAIFKNVMDSRKERYLEFIQMYRKDLESSGHLADRVELLKGKLAPFMALLEAGKD